MPPQGTREAAIAAPVALKAIVRRSLLPPADTRSRSSSVVSAAFFACLLQQLQQRVNSFGCGHLHIVAAGGAHYCT
jgi:hypothetical protein